MSAVVQYDPVIGRDVAFAREDAAAVFSGKHLEGPEADEQRLEHRLRSLPLHQRRIGQSRIDSFGYVRGKEASHFRIAQGNLPLDAELAELIQDIEGLWHRPFVHFPASRFDHPGGAAECRRCAWHAAYA